MSDPKPRDCIHGSLARKCEICDRDAEIERLQARVAELEKRGLALCHEVLGPTATISSVRTMRDNFLALLDGDSK